MLTDVISSPDCSTVFALSKGESGESILLKGPVEAMAVQEIILFESLPYQRLSVTYRDEERQGEVIFGGMPTFKVSRMSGYLNVLDLDDPLWMLPVGTDGLHLLPYDTDPSMYYLAAESVPCDVAYVKHLVRRIAAVVDELTHPERMLLMPATHRARRQSDFLLKVFEKAHLVRTYPHGRNWIPMHKVHLSQIMRLASLHKQYVDSGNIGHLDCMMHMICHIGRNIQDSLRDARLTPVVDLQLFAVH